MLYPQILHAGVDADFVNEKLGEGCRVIWIAPHQRNMSRFDVVLEGRVPEPDIDRVESVLEFLSTVSPSVIEREMLDNVDLGESPGQSAIRALVKVVRERIRATA